MFTTEPGGWLAPNDLGSLFRGVGAPQTVFEDSLI
jgi:hypothetical protein